MVLAGNFAFCRAGWNGPSLGLSVRFLLNCQETSAAASTRSLLWPAKFYGHSYTQGWIFKGLEGDVNLNADQTRSVVDFF